jgi:lipopolysaccharide/colanic/teichoic acid biosynthesis glycosyltransferase
MQSEEHQTNGFQPPPLSFSIPSASTVTEVRPDVRVARDIEADSVSWLAFLACSQQQPLGRMLYSTVFKRLLDVLAAATMLVLLAPLLVLVALVIRLESHGQVIFRQARVGRNGVPFTIYKFRTMIPDRRKHAAPISGEDRRKRHKSERDPRVTGVGRFLRRSSIDELPQLFNILKGDMSFIGPRPELPQIVDNYEDWQLQRHLVTPGLSGWWQVVGRSDLPMHENTELDIYYVVNQSFILDAKIVLLTFRALLSRGGAF